MILEQNPERHGIHYRLGRLFLTKTPPDRLAGIGSGICAPTLFSSERSGKVIFYLNDEVEMERLAFSTKKSYTTFL